MNEQPIPISLDPNHYYLSSVNINSSEEEFIFQLSSGTQFRNYLTSPKHAKRILMLLQKIINSYEERWGELETELPMIAHQTSEKKPVGFNVED